MTTYPYLESCPCIQGCKGRSLLLRISDSASYRIYGCGGPYGAGRRVEISILDARQRKKLGDDVADLMARRMLAREAGDRFLDRVFAWLPTPESVAEVGA